MERAEFSVGTGHWLGRGTSSIDQAIKLGRQLKKRGGAGGDFVLFFWIVYFNPKDNFCFNNLCGEHDYSSFFFFLPSHQSFLLLSARKDRLPRNIQVPELSLKSLFEVRWLLKLYGFKSGHPGLYLGPHPV